LKNKKLRLLVLLIANLVSLQIVAQVYRWDVKILIDIESQGVYNIRATTQTIADLAGVNSNRRPPQSELKNLRADAEKRKVKITAWVIATGHEPDGDYHLVLKDISGGKTMIGEIPDPGTVKLRGFPTLKTNYRVARAEVDNKIGTPPGRVTALAQKRKVKITGYVFFDRSAHGNGHADNGAEIHPISSIQVLQ
jgi:hypothetical protein